MSNSSIPRRLICCVDGTWCGPDGPNGKGYGNITNVYRIFVSVKEGRCLDNITQEEYFQEKFYEEGIGFADEMSTLDKAMAGIWGTGFKEIIKRVYRRCCLLDEKDEVWFYGFSRGAYIVRAVAGLLHYIWALRSAQGEDFDAEYTRALKIYENAEQRRRCGPGQLHHWITISAKRAPQIRFIGVFDTVKALNDGELYDITFNESTQHFRHALALNENRKAMKPEYAFTTFGEEKTTLVRRSVIQAWFVGAHIDMGGSAQNDGLALYPLQWILGESQAKGLVLEFSQLPHHRAVIDNPLRVVFPTDEDDGKRCDLWTCTTDNGIKVDIHDLRNVHSLDKFNQRYSLKINSRKAVGWEKENREPFNQDGSLKGHCPFAPQGTIIHPSVYQYLDEFLMTSWGKDALRDRETFEKWRPKMLGVQNSILNQGFWSDVTPALDDELKFIRILVVGNTGVGKSTLINRVFGISPSGEHSDVLEGAKISERERGIHNVEEEIKHNGRPDLIIHDSGGFEAGDESQMHAIRNFVKEKSSRIRIEERLHMIWFCVEMGSDRNRQTATESLFKAVSEYATEVPVIIVATKMDRFEGSQRMEAEEIFKPGIEDELEFFRKCKQHAADQLPKRLDLIEDEMRKVDDSHFEACVSVARNDVASINRLSEVTLENVKHERLRLLYVAAQIADIDLKLNSALIQTMRIYRRVLRTTSTVGVIPFTTWSNRTASAISICKAIVQCFGLPTINYNSIYEIVKSNVWDDLGHDVSVVAAKAIGSLGLVGTLLSGVPFVLAAGAMTIPLVVPATMRLILMLATDLILILTQAFKKTTYTSVGQRTESVGQPTEKDVENAARHYRPIAAKVHKEILSLVPKGGIVRSFFHNDVRLGLEKTVHRFKDEINDLDAGRVAPSSRTSSSSDRTMVEKEIAEMEQDIKAAEAELHQPEKIAEIRDSAAI